MTEEEMQKEHLKYRARTAVDVIMQAEQLKKEKDLKSYIKAEMKERAKCLDSALGTKKADTKSKSAAKKKK